MDSDNVKAIREGYEALAEQGPDGLVPMIAPEFEVTTPASMSAEPDTYRGPDGMLRYFASFYEAMDRITFTPHSFEEIGDRVVVEFTLRARGRSTGIEAEQHGFQVWQVRGGKAVGLELFQTLDEARGAAASAETGAA